LKPLATLSLCVLAAACGAAQPWDPLAGLSVVSGAGVLGAGCGSSTNPDYEAEPYLAVDPADPLHWVGLWQQGRYASGGGAQGLVSGVTFDGGKSWVLSQAPLDRCTGGNAANGGDYDRVSDPWLAFGADGTVYQSGLAFTNGAASAVLVAKSLDGGRTWSSPTAVVRDLDPNIFNDKATITADRADPQRLYAVWDRLTAFQSTDPALQTGAVWFARTGPGGWEAPRAIFDPGLNAQTLGNVLFQLPSGALVDLLVVITQASKAPVYTASSMTSFDQGATWSTPVGFAQLQGVGVSNPANGVGVRSGLSFADFAMDPTTGRLYAVWEDARFSQGAHDAVAFSTSADEGQTWSVPKAINGSAATPAFGPNIASTPRGQVGVTYYDLRHSAGAQDPTAFEATAWFVESVDQGGTWQETPLTGAFNLGQAEIGQTYFLGDYQGLAAAGETFVRLFAVAGPSASNPTDIVVKAL